MTGPPILRDLTVIVPTVGRPVLQQCLQSIADGTSWPEQLVLVDQGDESLVVAWVQALRRRGLSVEHLRRPRRGPGAARNRGAEVAATRWLAFNDDDQVVEPDWLTRMLDALRQRPDCVITGRVDAAAAGVPSTTSSRRPVDYTHPLRDRDPLFSGNMGLSRDVFERVGRFDEDLALNGAEDNEWGHRALRAGIPIVYRPEVAVTHLDWRDAAGLEETQRRYARAQGAFYGKHLRRGDVHIARRAVRDLARGPWLLTRAVLSRNQDLAVLGRAETLGILPGLLHGVRKPRR